MKAFEINEVYLAEDLRYLRMKISQLRELQIKVAKEASVAKKERISQERQYNDAVSAGVAELLKEMEELQQEMEFQLELTEKICALYEECEKKNADEILKSRLE